MNRKMRFTVIFCSVVSIILIYIAIKYIFTPYIFIGNVVYYSYDHKLFPSDITVDFEGNFYISAFSKYLIHQFNSNGKFVKSWGGPLSKDELSPPVTVAVDSEKNVYVFEHGRDFIRKYDRSGKLITRWTLIGYNNGDLLKIRAIAIDIYGNVLVADSYRCIQKFTSEGIFVEKLELPENNYSIAEEDIGDIVVDTKGNIYVAYWFVKKEDPLNMFSCIYKYDASGKFIDRIGVKNSKEKLFKNFCPELVSDFEGNIFVLDRFNHYIYKYDFSGNFLCGFGLKGLLTGYSKEPLLIAVDPQGNIYVVNGEEKEVQKFIPNPLFKLFN